MGRYICIHCHFYQPPRENPWLEAIEVQDTAFPFPARRMLPTQRRGRYSFDGLYIYAFQ